MSEARTGRVRAGRPVAIAVCVVMATLFSTAAAAQAQGGVHERLARIELALNNKGLLDLVRQIELLSEQVRQLRGELENQVFALEQQRNSQRSSYLDVDSRLVRLEQSVSGAPAAVAAAGLQSNTFGDALDPPLATLSTPGDATIAGQPAEQTIGVTVAAPLAAVAAAPTAVINDINAAAPGAAIIAVPRAPANPLPTAALLPAPLPAPSIQPSVPTIDSVESEAAYRAAFAMLKAGQYEASVEAFNAYLRQYPSSQYSDNAQYWLGEAYYVMRQFEPAISQYQSLVQNFPASKKQSHAMLKIGYSYYELGLTEQSATVLAELKARFPASAAARLADERLQRIRSEAP
jgi:tol-pal system protein YbgF